MALADWTHVSGYSTNFTQAKVAHSLLGSNTLSNHSTYCRRFSAPDSQATGDLYMYAGSGWSGSWPVSCRGFFREDSSGGYVSTDFCLFARASLDSNLLDTSSYYGVYYDGANGLFLLGNNSVSDYLQFSHAAHAYLGSGYSDDWLGLRLDVWTEGSDAHLVVYTCAGNANCDTLDAYGEPTWTKTIEAYHVSGETTPVVLVGDAGAGFGSGTVITSGGVGFGVGCPSAGGAQVCYVDSVGFKRIPTS